MLTVGLGLALLLFVAFGSGGGGTSNAVRTPVTLSDMYAAMKSADPSLSDTAIVSLLAQWDLETGGGASMYNYNVGNFKWNGTGAYFTIQTTENVNGVSTPMEQNFQSYDSLVDGVEAYLSAMQGQFGSSWADVESGDMDAFAQDLYDAGYYTGIGSDPVGTYAAGLTQRQSQIESALGIS